MTIKITLKNDFSQGIISDTLLSQITDNQIIVNNVSRISKAIPKYVQVSDILRIETFKN